MGTLIRSLMRISMRMCNSNSNFAVPIASNLISCNLVNLILVQTVLQSVEQGKSKQQNRLDDELLLQMDFNSRNM